MSYKKTSKKKYILIAVVALLLLGIATVFGAQISKDDQGYRTISVIEVSGRVSVVKNGVEYTAYPGMLLQEGQEVVTSGSSHVRMALDDDKYIKLESGSRAVFETLGFLGSGKTAINLERGSLTSELVNPLGAEDSYVINTPNAVLAVRGTFFRVDLSISDEGDVKSDVMTYGGQVASQRVQPTGEVVEEEVLIDAGYKASINMTTEETHYVVENEVGEIIVVEPTPSTDDGEGTTETVLPTQLITTADIPDEDLVDVYFAAENGHELFLSAEEAKTDIEVREIKIEEKTSVYEKAEEVKIEQEVIKAKENGVSNIISVSAIANDSKPIAMAPVVKEDDDTGKNNNTNVSNNTSSSTSGSGSSSSTNLVTDGDVHKHEKATKRIAPTCTQIGQEIVYCRTCNKNLSVTELSVTGHTEVNGASVDVHRKCSTCGISLSTNHSYVVTTTTPTCTQVGSNTYTCACGYSYMETLPAHGHKEQIGGLKDAHKKCSECGTIISSEHKITNTGYIAPTCTKEGSEIFSCECGYTYTNKVAPIGHVEVYGGTWQAHTICGVCSTVLSETHELTGEMYEAGTCVSPNKAKFSCICGFYNITQSGYGDHVYEAKVDYMTGENYEECSECGDIVWEFEPILLDSNNFPDENFRSYLSTTAIDKNQDRYLSKSEIDSVTKIDVKGDGFGNEIYVDAGIHDLTGIEYFTSLTTLWAGYNTNLTELDLSQNVNLEYVIIPWTGIETLDLSNCTAVVSLDVECCSDLNDLEIANCTEMVVITANGTSISRLDISAFPNLLSLEIGKSENLSQLITNDTGYPNLTTLDVGSTGLQEIDFSLFSNVKNLTIDCVMSEYDLSPCNSLTNLYFYGGSGLESFAYTQSNLKNIHFFEENGLKELILSNSGVMDLDITKCVELETLDLTNTFFRELNLEGRHTLKNLTLGCQYLHTLNVSGTNITELDLSSCGNMNSLTANNIPTMDSISDIILPENPIITELSLDMSRWSFDDSDMDWFANLTSLSVAGCGIDDLAWLSISPNLSNGLLYLDISENTALTSVDLINFPNIKTLKVKGLPFQRLDIRDLAQLEELDIRNTGITTIDTSNSGVGLMVTVTDTPALKTFKANGTSIEFENFTSDQLAWLQNVEYIGVGGTSVTDSRLFDILNVLPTSIKELDLSSSSNLGSIEIDRFPDIKKLYVRYCTSLTSINIMETSAENVTIYVAGCQTLYTENIFVPDGVILDIDIHDE